MSQATDMMNRENGWRTAARLEKLEQLGKHPWYGNLAKRLTEGEFDEIVSIIEDNEHLDRGGFTMMIQRLYLDQKKKPKHLTLMMDLLMAVREEER